MRDKVIEVARSCDHCFEVDGKFAFYPDDLVAFYHAAVAAFLKDSGQYVTNDASREECIRQETDRVTKERDRLKAALELCVPHIAAGYEGFIAYNTAKKLLKELS